jgi:hypothetical protein
MPSSKRRGSGAGEKDLAAVVRSIEAALAEAPSRADARARSKGRRVDVYRVGSALCFSAHAEVA